ncbi:MAG TPA: response regulator [Stellaceae bacterium]|nr:response regulator [Stellaceae bacterium]
MVFRESHLFQGLNISIAGVLDSLRLLLEAYGYGVVTAADGRKGLAASQKHAPSVVVGDILMPEQDGIGAIREMRRLCPGAKIIAMSGGGRIGSADFLGMAKKLGANDIIPKPFLPQELLRRIKACLGGA